MNYLVDMSSFLNIAKIYPLHIQAEFFKDVGVSSQGDVQSNPSHLTIYNFIKTDWALTSILLDSDNNRKW